jgi:hypothetical protein
MEELMRKKCEEYDISFDVLTDEEKAKLREEIEAEQQGFAISDSVLDDPEIAVR